MRAAPHEAKAVPSSVGTPSAFQSVTRGGSVSAPLRILVVEDDVLIGMLLADMLGEMGHVVCSIEATEANAITAAALHKPDMMIVDVRLHVGNGISAMEHILRTNFVPHVCVSGDVHGVLKSRPGAIVIEKPFTELMLARAIERARTTKRAAGT